MSLNCRSLRSLPRRHQLSALLLNYDIDLVFGCKSHINQSFSSSEILPKNYKIIRKDHSLGGGGVFIGFRDNLNTYQEVFLKNGNSGEAAGKEERAIET